MEAADRKKLFRAIYARTFRYLAVGLVASALIGGVYGDLLHAVYALTASGCVMICWGWFTYLRMTGMRVFGFKPNGKKRAVPYIHQRIKAEKRHRPLFLRTNDEFDDDLNGATAVDEECLSEKQRDKLRALARATCGILLILTSFVIKL